MSAKEELIRAVAPLAVKIFFGFLVLAVVAMAGGILLGAKYAVGMWRLVEAIADGVAGVSLAITATAFALWLLQLLQARDASRTFSGATAEMRCREAATRRRISQGILAGMAKAVLVFSIGLAISLGLSAALLSLSGESAGWARALMPVAVGLSVGSAVLLVNAGILLLIAWIQYRERPTTSGAEQEGL